MSGFGDETAAATGQRVLARREGVDQLKLDTVAVLRELDRRGGSANITQLTRSRTQRVYVRRCLMLAAREGLVRCPGGDRFTLTEKARDAIPVDEQVA